MEQEHWQGKWQKSISESPQIVPEPINAFISKYHLECRDKSLWVCSFAVFNILWEWHSDQAGFLPQLSDPQARESPFLPALPQGRRGAWLLRRALS